MLIDIRNHCPYNHLMPVQVLLFFILINLFLPVFPSFAQPINQVANQETVNAPADASASETNQEKISVPETNQEKIPQHTSNETVKTPAPSLDASQKEKTIVKAIEIKG